MSSLSSLVGSPAPVSPTVPDLSDSFGYPLEEGDPIPPGTGSSGAPGGAISAGPSGSSSTAGAAGAATGYQLSSASAALLGQNAGPLSGQSAGVQTAAAQSGVSQSGVSQSGVSQSGVSQSGAVSQAGGSPEGGSFGASVVADAEKYIGVPYQWGGTNPAQGVDCSGLVQDVFGDLGVSLPRTSQEQATAGVAVPSLAAAQPGDLVFFPGTDGTASAPGHVGIYIGNDQMIDAPYSGATVRLDPVVDPTAIRRVSGPSTSPAASSTAGTYGADFAGASASTGVPEALLNAVASTESSFQPGAVSSAGAEGLMQLMPTTAASLGVNPFNPPQAVNAAAHLLSNYHEQFGSWSLALAAYNAGPAAVQAYSGVPPYSQTQNYVQTVLSRAGMEGQ